MPLDLQRAFDWSFKSYCKKRTSAPDLRGLLGYGALLRLLLQHVPSGLAYWAQLKDMLIALDEKRPELRSKVH